VDYTVNRALRKTLRDRLLKDVRYTYDLHFSRPGGRSMDYREIHEFAMAKALGSTWMDISTQKGAVAAQEDRSRKAVSRGREILTGATLLLIRIAGPDSDAPPEVKEEFSKLSDLVRTRA
jgi:hypothetical protein